MTGKRVMSRLVRIDGTIAKPLLDLRRVQSRGFAEDQSGDAGNCRLPTCLNYYSRRNVYE